MYGLVNKAIKQFVIESYDQHHWLEITKKASLKDDVFLAMEAYDDNITYSLVNAASNYLNISADNILIAFGQFWIEFAEKEGYGSMLDMAGDNLVDFTRNLDLMHTHIAQSYQEMQPPSFQCEELSNTCLKLIYSSQRQGLQSFVKGLLIGLGKRFKLQLEISDMAISNNKHEFTITYSKAL